MPSRCHPQPPLSPPGAGVRGPVARAAVALAGLATVVAIGCQTGPPPPGPPSPVYTAEIDGRTLHWRYVPLDSRAREHPTDEAFGRARAVCDGPEALDCLAGLGFYVAECSDGVDNDGDGAVDHPADPGCAERHALEEAPACDDDLDNDGDGLADWNGGPTTHPDPECIDAPSRNRESPDPKRGWGWGS